MDPEDLKETLLQKPSVEEPQEESRTFIVLFFWFGWSIAFSCELYAMKLSMDTCAYIGQDLVCNYNPKVDTWIFVGYIIMLFVIVIICVHPQKK